MNECYERKLADLAQIRAGYPARGSIKPDPDSEIAIVQIRDFNADRTLLDIDGLTRFDPGRPLKDELILQPGDILFLARGAKNFAYTLPGLPTTAVASGYFHTLRLTSTQTSPRYLTWYLRQDPILDELKRFSGSGVHMPVIKRSTLEDLPISLPPLAIQEKIVELDELMQQEQALLFKLARKRKQLITAVISPAITPKRMTP